MDKTSKRVPILAALRKAHGLTQRQVAAEAGMDERAVQRLEHGEIDPANMTL